MTKWECKVCGGLYDEGFYAQHRVGETHLAHVTPKQAKYGGPTQECEICHARYSTGTYDMHKTSDIHLPRTAYGRKFLKRYEGLIQLARRDAFILASLRAGGSYGELAQELGISRQRVHQIAKKNGVASLRTRAKPPVVILAKTCFFDGHSYVDWAKHILTTYHMRAEAEVQAKISQVRSSHTVRD